MSIFVVIAKKKTALHYSFFAGVLTVFIWTVAVMLQSVFFTSEDKNILFENISYFGSALAPVSIVFLAKAYIHPDKKISYNFV